MTTDSTPTTTDPATATDTAAAPTVQQVDPRTLLVDPNVRRDAHVDTDLIASVRDLGVLVPIVAVRSAERGLRVRFGHRRTLAAIEAGWTAVPVVAVADEVSDDAAQVERLVTQWAENEHRAGLTTAERVGVIAHSPPSGSARHRSASAPAPSAARSPPPSRWPAPSWPRPRPSLRLPRPGPGRRGRGVRG